MVSEWMSTAPWREWNLQHLQRRKERTVAITLKRNPGDKLLELGGGSNPVVHPRCRGGVDVAVDARTCHDPHGHPTVDFTADFEKPLPISSSEFDGVVCLFCLEHLSFRAVPGFLKELLRVIKPGAKAVVAVPNTRAQLRWLADHPEGWDGKDLFTAASEMLFGSQDYQENTHKCFFDPPTITSLFRAAGFGGVVVRPYGERDTDMVVEAVKSREAAEGAVRTDGDVVSERVVGAAGIEGVERVSTLDGNASGERVVAEEGIVEVERVVRRDGHGMEERVVRPEGNVASERVEGGDSNVPEERAGTSDGNGGSERVEGYDGGVVPERVEKNMTNVVEMLATGQGRKAAFDKFYFNGGGKVGGYAREGYWDFPVHEITARHVLARRPASVLELGCARGYVLKRLQDAGVQAAGYEISKHAHMTRVCDGVRVADLCVVPWWPFWVGERHQGPAFDLCFSAATLEHVPEQSLPAVIAEMARVCKRGLHGVDFGGRDDGFDRTHVTLHPREWWVEVFAQYAPGWPVEVVDKEELERGEFPKEVLEGDGRLKLNLGSFTTMFHHGWTNVDVHDLAHFARANGYKFLRHDLKNDLPFGTGVVDCIFLHHVLEHFTYQDGLRLLRECRRVVRPDGALRVVVPDADVLVSSYQKSLPEGGCEGWDYPNLSDFDEINDGCAQAPTPAGKLWALLHEGHSSCYDWETLERALADSGWDAFPAKFRGHANASVPYWRPRFEQILRETLEMPFGGISLFADAVPKTT